MNQQIVEDIGHLIRLFDTARQNENCREPLAVWLSVLDGINDLSRTQELTEGQELARSYLVACEFLFECWATLGFRSSFRIARTLLERAALEMASTSANSAAVQAQEQTSSFVANANCA